MNKKLFIRQTVLPLTAALIWGMSFVVQSYSADFIGPFSFNTARCTVGAIFLAVLWAVMRKIEKKKTGTAPKENKKMLIIGGIVCGIMLAACINLQQAGLSETSPGKAGFITALYVVLVPFAGLFLGKKSTVKVWIGVLIAVVALYLLCMTGGDFHIEHTDFLVLLCAIAAAAHILFVDYYTRFVGGVALSFMQFAVAAVISAICMAFAEKTAISVFAQCFPAILYMGILSSGVGYTLQIIAQKGGNPTIVSLLMSFESVFSAIFGALILNDIMSTRELCGCILMFAAVIIAQLPEKKRGD